MYSALKFFVWCLALVPLPILDALSRVMTFVFFDLFRIRRKLMLKNLTIAFGESYGPSEKKRIARTAFRNFLQTIFESLVSHRHPIDGKVAVEGRTILDEALAEGRGTYILCLHMGNWEALAAAISHQFRPAYAVMKTIGSAGVTRFVEELREKNGVYWIKRKAKGDAYRQMVEILNRGEIVGFMMDQARPGEPRLPFFSQDAKTNTSLAAIWQKRPAPIVVASIVRRRFGEHLLTVGPRLEPEDLGDPKSDAIRNSILFNRAVEDVIRRNPEHYFWFHNRWK